MIPADYRERSFTFDNLELIVKEKGVFGEQYFFDVIAKTPSGEGSLNVIEGALWKTPFGDAVAPGSFEYIAAAGAMLSHLSASKNFMESDYYTKELKFVTESAGQGIFEGSSGNIYAAAETVSLETIEEADKELNRLWHQEVPLELLRPKGLTKRKGAGPSPVVAKWLKRRM